MLLRRITKHVTDQNWFAVFIDFLIVVVGVFIGIQVSNWNNALSERGAESEYLVALEQDVISSLAEIKSAKEILMMQDEARQTLYQYSLSEKSGLDSAEWPELINRGLWSFKSLALSNTTFESLRSSGKLDVLSGEVLAFALQDLSVLLNETRREQNDEMTFVERFGDPILYENIDLGAVFQQRSLNDKNRVYVPWVKESSGTIGKPEFLKTQQFRNALLIRSSMNTERIETLERVKNKYTEIQKLIEKRKKELGID